MTAQQTPRGRSHVAGAGVLAAAFGSTLAVPAQAGAAAAAGPLSVTVSAQTLTVTGDSSRNVMVMGQTPDRVVTLNGAEVVVDGVKVRVGDLALILLSGGAGDDILRLSGFPDTPRGEPRGGEGNDTLDGGSNDDLLDGGPGIDAINGLAGANDIFGGDGNDKIIGGQGDDVVSAGEGSDEFTWTPLSRNDVLDGGDGTDTLKFFGSNLDENVTFTAAVHRVVVSRSPKGENLSADERLLIAGFEFANADLAGGIDTATVNDLTGSGLRVLQLTYADGSDPHEDRAIIVGTTHADQVRFFGNPVPGSPLVRALSITGLTPTVHVNGAESLVLFAQGGSDVMDASRLCGELTALTVSGGLRRRHTDRNLRRRPPLRR